MPSPTRPALRAGIFPDPAAPPAPRSRQPWIWGATGLVLVAAVALLGALADATCLRAVFILLLTLWVVVTVFLGLRWLWRRLTYRIGTRLFLSYLLIGALPFLIFLFVACAAGYVLLGQYTATAFRNLSEQLQEELAVLTQSALDQQRSGEAAVVLGRGPRLPGALAGAALTGEWFLATLAGTPRASAGAGELAFPAWAPEGTTTGPFLLGERPVLAAITRRGDRIAAAFLACDKTTARVLSERLWYAVQFEVSNVRITETRITVDRDATDAEEPAEEPAEESAEEPAGAKPKLSWWRQRRILFASFSPDLRRWRDGQTVAQRSVVSVVTTSVQEATADFFRSPQRMGRQITQTFQGLGVFFALVYLGVVLLAAFQIFAITRAAARLTRGARKVESGELDYRIPVRRRDQLGDLAISFNRMTEAVERMLVEVAEKERLEGELDLAREIQRSLLPANRLRHGDLAVTACFRPAAEVGGDYFDLFPLAPHQLLVASGDVAGHGLSTGLLMAMVKSAVSTLVHEGHRGAPLLERLNRFMLDQPRRHRMVTLTLVEIDTENGVAEIANAGHPPILCLAGGEVREVMLPALPLGSAWRRPPPSLTLELPPGWRLVIFSDGLVEALDPRGEPLGYERLRGLLERHAGLTAEALLAVILAELDRHTARRPLDDDLTVLIVEQGAGAVEPEIG